MIYDMPFLRHSGWFLRNIVGNWEIAPIYTYQTGTLVDVQSGVDSNLNADPAGDRAFINPSGTSNLGSGVTALTNSSGDVVGYLADNPNARYIEGGLGTFPNGGRNTAHLNPIDDVDMTLAKNVNITESKKVQFSARFFNIFNHPQYVGGFINDVAPFPQTAGVVQRYLEPQSGIFLQPSQAFSSNPRSLQLALKFIF